ncbi:MAG: hypothetical protein ACYC69_17360 [Thermodesulfovibrionales bacterium]
MQTKLCRPLEELGTPIYLNKEVEEFFSRKAIAQNVKLERGHTKI